MRIWKAGGQTFERFLRANYERVSRLLQMNYAVKAVKDMRDRLFEVVHAKFGVCGVL